MSFPRELNKVKPDLIFNICEGFNGPARESVYAAILEQYKYNYSGPDSTNLLVCHNKYLSKSRTLFFLSVNSFISSRNLLISSNN